MTGSHSASAFIALGGNLGDRLATLRSALAQLDILEGVEVGTTSHVYETAPIGPSNAPFLNAAAALSTTLAPQALLDALHAIERAHGRERRVRWDARTLDLDLLLYFEPGATTPLTCGDAGCRLPHPAMMQRDFVLAPLLELAPDLAVDGLALRDALAAIRPPNRTVLRRLDPLRGPG